MKLGGWKRLWIVACVLYALVVVVIALAIKPSLHSTYNQWFSDASSVMAKAISKAENHEYASYEVRSGILNRGNAENVAYLKRVAKSPTRNQEIFSAKIATINAKYERKVARFPHRMTIFSVEAFCWWLGGAIIIYLFGWSIGWIIRGFRRGSA